MTKREQRAYIRRLLVRWGKAKRNAKEIDKKRASINVAIAEGNESGKILAALQRCTAACEDTAIDGHCHVCRAHKILLMNAHRSKTWGCLKTVNGNEVRFENFLTSKNKISEFHLW